MLNVKPLAVAISLVAASLGVALSTASDYSTGVKTDYPESLASWRDFERVHMGQNITTGSEK